jgi:hypothetical protein
MTVVYDAGWQGRKVRALTWFLLAAGVLFCWLGTLRPKVPPPPGEEASAAEWFLVTLFAFGTGIATAGAGLLYGRCYIGRVEVADDDTVHLRTIGPLRSPLHVFRPEDLGGGRYHDGQFETYKHSVNAPWYTVRVRGRRIPLILDPQGDVIDDAGTERALGLERGSLAVWEIDRPRAPNAALTPLGRKRRTRGRRRR